MSKYIITGAIVGMGTPPVFNFLAKGMWHPEFPSEALALYAIGIMAMGLVGSMVGNFIGWEAEDWH